MIICLSGFVIAGTSPTSAPLGTRADINVMDRVCVGAGPAVGVGVGLVPPGSVGVGVGLGARYSPHHHQLLQHFAPPLPNLRGATRSSSSSAESVSSHSASPPPHPLPPPPHAAHPSSRHLYPHTYTRVRTLYACLGESEGELSFEPNQIITNVAPSGEPGWLRGSLNGKAGLVPENYVEPLP